MSDVIRSYNALSSSSPRPDVSVIFQSIINAPPHAFVKTSRAELIQAILRDLKTAGPKSRLTAKDAAQALLAVKTLGKNPTGSENLATPATLSTLLSFATTFKDEPEASSEALRCIANTLLLFDYARATFVGKEVNGGDVCFALLDKSTTPDQIFILSRILFLATVSGPALVISLVEDKRHGRTVVDLISAKLDTLIISILSGTKLAREAMADLLKFTFNLLLHYPKMVDAEPQNPGAGDNSHKVIGDVWSSNLDGLLPPLLRVFYSLPPTFPCPLISPLTHCIHALITVPVNNASLQSIWFGPPTPQRRSSSNTSSPKFANTTSPGSSSRSDSPTLSQTPPKSTTLDRALSVLSGKRASRSPSPHPPHLSADILLRAYDLLEVTFSHYFPENIDCDDPSVREKPKKESLDGSLDDICSPLIVLITRICLADEASRARLREWIVPRDLDRSSPLEQRSDLLGRCLRLMGSVYHTRLKDSIGEMLFAMSDSDATTLSSLVGYGNVAGFLFNKGIMSAPPPPSGPGVDVNAPDGKSINPITGNTMARPELPDMTEEEKEAEMEKLFVLFDRLERTGALPANQNPIRKAMQQSQSS
ncbi:guanine nucleotide exchange factor [Mucidula mucida]|nr:guanine nucleotide exchange factor [Mucidula mucida]